MRTRQLALRIDRELQEQLIEIRTLLYSRRGTGDGISESEAVRYCLRKVWQMEVAPLQARDTHEQETQEQR